MKMIIIILMLPILLIAGVVWMIKQDSVIDEKTGKRRFPSKSERRRKYH